MQMNEKPKFTAIGFVIIIIVMLVWHKISACGQALFTPHYRVLSLSHTHTKHRAINHGQYKTAV